MLNFCKHKVFFEITIFENFVSSKNFVKNHSFQNMFHGYKQFENLLNPI